MKDYVIYWFIVILVITATALNCMQKTPIPAVNAAEDTTITPKFDANGYWQSHGILFHQNEDGHISYYGTKSLYGSYLAGRVAHLRQDFNNAAEYYKIAMNKDVSNSTLNRTVYVILSSLGQIGEAEPYARKEIELGNTESIAPLIIAVKDFADGKYADSRANIQMIKDTAHETIINPLITAWTYAGEKDEEKAIASIDTIINDPTLETMKLFHKGLIYDYLGNLEKAEEMYQSIVEKHQQNVTYRLLEIITNFYVRKGDKDTARKIFGRYSDDGLLAILLNDIDKNIENTSQNSALIIDTPQKGLAEAMFNIGTLFRSSVGGIEFAQIYIAGSSYLNPDYDISKIALANVLEELGLLKEANKYYAQISKDSGSYFIARAKMIDNLNTLDEYEAAEQQIKLLLEDYPNNTQLLSDLGTIYSNMHKNQEAAEYYQKALQTLNSSDNSSWPIHYSLAVAYDKLNQKLKSEQHLQRALELSNQNPDILNYLGYSWLVQGRNIDGAAEMILKAYYRYPYEGHIIDSLGWVYYNLGMYKKSVEFLEQAAALNPGNAVINNHLGDAYWFTGRKNEATFQWRHALDLKEDAEDIDKKAIKEKIENGLAQSKIYQLQNQQLLETLQNLTLPEER